MRSRSWRLSCPASHMAFLVAVVAAELTGLAQGPNAAADDLPAGWTTAAPCDEIMPAFAFDATGGPQRDGSFVIRTNAGEEQHGWYQRSFPVTGGTFYLFHAVRNVDNVAVPRRSAPVRIVWKDEQGKAVLADVPVGHEQEQGLVPLAEPEHPRDIGTDADGWTEVAGTYRAPSKATQAVVELHLQWAPLGRVAWSAVAFTETSPPPSRKVRLATIHHRPSGKSSQANCEEFAPLIAEAANQRADLVVLGETVPSVGIGKQPHEIAEAIPGPTTQYFGEIAKKYQIHIVVSLDEREGHAVYNAAVLIGPDGSLLGKYRKVCLPHSEIESGVTPGSDYPVFDTQFGKVGMMICYDGFFPEVARELANRGAEVIAWPVWGCNQLLARARACENHVYVVSSTYMDVKDDWMISAVFDHAGQPIARAEKWDSVAIAEVDLSERHFWRNNLGDFHAMIPRHRPVLGAEPSRDRPSTGPR